MNKPSACLHIVCKPVSDPELQRCLNLLASHSALVLLPEATALLKELEKVTLSVPVYLVTDGDRSGASKAANVECITYHQLADITATYSNTRSW